jgi:hypothetical protein
MKPSEAFGQLITVFREWDGFLKDPRYIRRGNEITWSDAHAISVPDRLTRDDVLSLSRRGQFTFRVTEDEALIQISYRYSTDGELAAARLAYYGIADDPVKMRDGDFEEGVLPIGETQSLYDVATWVRFDYLHTGLARVIHMDSHLHISGLPSVRFAVTGVPTPRQFIEFIVSHFYPASYQKIRLDKEDGLEGFDAVDKVNALSCPLREPLEDIYRRIPHFRLPGY